jgi:hypothetical protein
MLRNPVLVLTALAALTAGRALAQVPHPTEAAASPAQQAPNRAVTSPGNADWAADAAEAVARAASQKKLVYYEFDGPGCGNCRRMQVLIYPAFDFEALLVGMVPVKLALDSPAGKKLGARYGITEVPSVLITTPEGRLVFKMEGFRDAPDFYEHAHKDLDAYRQLAKRVDGQDIANLSAAEAYSTGRELYTRFDYAGAAVRLKRAATAADATPALREDALMGLAAAQNELGQLAEARRSADKVIATTKNADQKQRAELFVAQLSLTENDPARALAAYKKFAADHPRSPYLATVNGFIAKLEAAAPKQ